MCIRDSCDPSLLQHRDILRALAPAYFLKGPLFLLQAEFCSLSSKQPLLLTAARCCGPEVVALFAEQTAILSPKQKERAIQEVRWGKRPENIPVLEQAGITVNKFGGESFRAAVSEGNTKLAQLLLEKGADINYHKPDMVFPNASTAVSYTHLDVYKRQALHGSDLHIRSGARLA